MLHTLFTFGYTGRKPDELKVLADAGKLILDIRYNPTSRVQHWRGRVLQQTLGGSYQWCISLGNVNYKTGDPIQLLAPDLGFRKLAAWLEQQEVVLLCACKDVATCHRSVVAAEAQTRWPELEVVHL